MTAMPREETVASFRNGIKVLRSFTRDHRQQTITETATRNDLSRSAARRLLFTLCQAGLARTDGKYFQLTPNILALGQAFLAGMSELEVVRDVLLDFTRQSGESASAAMLVDTEVIYVTRLPSPSRNLPVAVGPGMRRPAHATSIGQMLLSKLHPRELDKVLANMTLDPCGPRSITDKRVLRARLDQVRTQGYATTTEELSVGHASIAVAVPQADTGLLTGSTRLGLASSVQPDRMDREAMIERLLPGLQRAAADISSFIATM